MSSHLQGNVANTAPAGWDEFVEKSPESSIYHRADWLNLVSNTFGHRVHFIAVRTDAGSLRGVLPLVQQRSLLFGNFLTSLPFFNYGGPLFDSADAYQALLSEAELLARRLGVRHVELRTQLEDGLGWMHRDDKVTLIRDLPSSVGALSAEMGSKLRSQIRRVERENPVIRKGGVELAGSFYHVFSRNMRDLGTPVYPRRFFEDLLRSFPGDCRIVCVELRGVPSAAGFLITHKGTTEIPWASCLTEMKPLGANMRLYWECLCEALSLGSKRFDFGRSSVDAGTYRFKLQWGAKPVPLHWYYWLPSGSELPQLHHGNARLALAIRVWKRLPLWACEALGPHLIRNLP